MSKDLRVSAPQHCHQVAAEEGGQRMGESGAERSTGGSQGTYMHLKNKARTVSLMPD